MEPAEVDSLLLRIRLAVEAEVLPLVDRIRENESSSFGAEAIKRERLRQVTEEGWTPEHDDSEHNHEELAVRAAELALAGTSVELSLFAEDAWGLIEKHPNRIRRLEIAGALIAAEIDRLARVGKEN